MAGAKGGARPDWERQQRALARQVEQEQRAAERARVAAEKAAKQRHLEARVADTERKNQKLERTVESLNNLLRGGLSRSARFDLGALRVVPKVPQLDLGDLADPVRKPDWGQYSPRSPGAVSRLFGGAARYERELEIAKARYERAVGEAEKAEVERQRRVVVAREEHGRRVAKAEAGAREQNLVVDKHIRGFAAREKAAVEGYFGHVLKRVPLPKGFPHNVDVTFNPRSEQVIVRFELPPRTVVPAEAGYRYLSTKDEVRSVARPKNEVAALYRSVISQVALLCVRDLFDGDRTLASVGFNGHVHATNPATGEHEYPCIISISVERGAFPPDSNLEKVSPEACVRHLKAIVSSHPYELEPIQPILDFDLSKFSFVDGFDAVSTLDSRPDLMDMSYTNFEHLVRQIFEAQGAEGWTTQQSNDDGVDAVIVQRQALMGGLSIVQAKRYSRSIGVNHIRELAGAMEEKKAGWGILITTSWFTPKCWEKAREHGRMELIDGERLVYLIKEHLKKDVLIGISDRPRSRSEQ
ncbi:restriction endonuclease [Actinokineospora inagensis]|uniref:restriction endonuclease n=1 Tax=Actinokineospora inagensis TaxID=103730 RepID=UPI000A06EAF4|nr:restriction endonuclease [Actinokineospora inagensis]